MMRTPTGRPTDVNFAAASGGGGSWSLLLMMALIFGAMYFLMIRPQQRRRRQIEQMQSALGVGDEVVTIGGLYGIVTSVDDDTVTLEVAPGVENKYARGAISRVTAPGHDIDAVDEVVETQDAKDARP